MRKIRKLHCSRKKQNKNLAWGLIKCATAKTIRVRIFEDVTLEGLQMISVHLYQKYNDLWERNTVAAVIYEKIPLRNRLLYFHMQ